MDHIQTLYSSDKRIKYVSDGTGQHFKNAKNILNLTYHHNDSGLYTSWSFIATAHGKGPMGGSGAAIKYRVTRHILSGKAKDAILSPE